MGFATHIPLDGDGARPKGLRERQTAHHEFILMEDTLD
jgi:hypothetical protein